MPDPSAGNDGHAGWDGSSGGRHLLRCDREDFILVLVLWEGEEQWSGGTVGAKGRVDTYLTG